MEGYQQGSGRGREGEKVQGIRSTIGSYKIDREGRGRSMGGIYPGQSAARIGCDHLPPTSALCGLSLIHI